MMTNQPTLPTSGNVNDGPVVPGGTWIVTCPQRAVDERAAVALSVAAETAGRLHAVATDPVRLSLAGSMGIALASYEKQQTPLRMPIDIDLMRTDHGSFSGRSIASALAETHETQHVNHRQWRGTHKVTGLSVEIVEPHMQLSGKDLRSLPTMTIAGKSVDAEDLSQGTLKGLTTARLTAMKLYDLAVTGSGKSIYDLATLERIGAFTAQSIKRAEQVIMRTSENPHMASRQEIGEGLQELLGSVRPERVNIHDHLKTVNPLISKPAIANVMSLLRERYGSCGSSARHRH